MGVRGKYISRGSSAREQAILLQKSNCMKIIFLSRVLVDKKTNRNEVGCVQLKNGSGRRRKGERFFAGRVLCTCHGGWLSLRSECPPWQVQV